MRILRIQMGGGFFAAGSLNICLFFMSFRNNIINNMAKPNPNIGDIRSESPTSMTFDQLRATDVLPGSNINAIPSPKIEPIRVCELEQGIPIYHVARFQIIAVTIKANTIAMLWERLLSIRTSEGRRLIIPIATAIPPTLTPIKFQNPDQMTATVGLSECV